MIKLAILITYLILVNVLFAHGVVIEGDFDGRIAIGYEEAVEVIPDLDNVRFTILADGSEYCYTTWRTVMLGRAIVGIEVYLSENFQARCIYHELGHVYMLRLYGYRADKLPDIQGVQWNRVITWQTTPEMALVEGWACYIETLINGQHTPPLEITGWPNYTIPHHVSTTLYSMDADRLWTLIGSIRPQTMRELAGRYNNGRIPMVWGKYRR